MDIAVNYLAVAVAAVAAMVIGSLWYSPLLFGRQWMALTGRDPEGMKGMAPPMRETLAELAAALVTSFVIAALMFWTGTYTLFGGLSLGFFLWLGFYAPALLAPVLWEGRPFALFLLNAFQRLICVLVMAGVLSVWQ